jgi:cytochrome P450
MLLAYRLVRLIETHADKLADGTLARLKQDDKMRSFCERVPCDDFRNAVLGIYSHLGEWFMGKSEQDIARRYCEIGQRRAEQGVLLSELNWAIVIARESLWEFLEHEDTLERPTEVFGELKLLQMLEQFFDRAIYWAAVGYEQHKGAEKLACSAVSK